jgi:hypothetical protein
MQQKAEPVSQLQSRLQPFVWQLAIPGKESQPASAKTSLEM